MLIKVGNAESVGYLEVKEQTNKQTKCSEGLVCEGEGVYLYTPSGFEGTNVSGRPKGIGMNWSGWFSMPSIGIIGPVFIP